MRVRLKPLTQVSDRKIIDKLFYIFILVIMLMILIYIFCKYIKYSLALIAAFSSRFKMEVIYDSINDSIKNEPAEIEYVN